MYKRLFGPVCLVEVKAVLLCLPVKGDQPLVVHARFPALISGIRGKVKHIPYMCGPHPGVPLKAFEHILMVDRLILFRVVATARMRGVQVRHAFAAVLAVTQAAVRINLVEEVHPQVVQEQARYIPAEVQVPADGIRYMSNRIEWPAHRIACQRGKAGRVHFMAEVVKHFMVVQHVCLVFGGYRDLVAHAPADDGSMIVVLGDQFLHLGDGILPAVRHMLGDIGDLRPHDHPAFIAEIIEILVMLVMRQTDGVGPHLADQVHILEVLFLRDGIAETFPVLMAGDTSERIAPAVEIKTCFGMIVKVSHAEAGGHFIPACKACHSSIEIRILQAVPEADVVNCNGNSIPVTGSNLFPFGIQNPDMNGIFAVRKGFHLYFRLFVSFHRLCRNLDTRSAVIVQIKMI